MKKITVLTLALIFLSTGFSQKVYFVYLQSENQQPFFARLNDKTYSSTSSGYLILSKLRDSSYTVNIGFPGTQLAEQKFSVVVNKKDQGLLLKNMGEQGWALFNMQTLALLMADKTTDVVKTEKQESNTFTDMLSKAVDDSTLKEKPVVVKEEKKPEEIPANKKDEDTVAKISEPPVVKTEEKKVEPPPAKISEVKTDTADKKDESEIEVKEESKKDTGQAVIENKTENIPVEEPYKKSTVTRHSESSTTEGFGLTFFDTYPDGKIDTIRILIPGEATKPVVQPPKQEEKKFLDIIPADTIHKQPTPETEKAKTEPQQSKNNCTVIAVEDDFFIVRKNMAAQTNDEGMIEEAKKVFKTKCFSVQQVKNLSSLFLSDEGKYKFFDAAYSYVSDPSNFASLQSELKDEYYINRFKAMLR